MQCVLHVCSSGRDRRKPAYAYRTRERERERERGRAREDDGPNETLGERKNERQIISNSNNAIAIVVILI